MTERVFLDATSGNNCDWYARVVVREGASDVEISLATRGGWGFLSSRGRVIFKSLSRWFAVLLIRDQVSRPASGIP